MKRLMVFIDNSNVFQGSKYEGFRIDYKRLVSFLTNSGIDWLGNYDLCRVTIYAAKDVSQKPEETAAATLGTYSMFDRFPKFDVKLIDIETKDEAGNIKVKPEKGLDVALAVDMVMLASRDAFDVAILVAGDGDYVPAVESVMQMGKEIYVAYYRTGVSSRLKERSLGYIDLTRYRDQVEKV